MATTSTAIGQQQLAQAYNQSGTLTTSSSPYVTSTGVLTSPTYISGNVFVSPQTPWISDDDEWGDGENQEAAGFGWMLTGAHLATLTPTLCALSFGTKKDKTEKELIQDVVEHAMCGDCAIAYKILGILSRNRSPYCEWEATHQALIETYEPSR